MMTKEELIKYIGAHGSHSAALLLQMTFLLCDFVLFMTGSLLSSVISILTL